MLAQEGQPFFQAYKVIFDIVGNEIQRIPTPNEIGKTYVRILNPLTQLDTDVAIPMPNIIGGYYEHPRYQVYDYRIAIEVFLLNTKIAKLKTERNAFAHSADAYTKLEKTYFIHTKAEHTFRKLSALPAPLDPTIVKAILIQESGGEFEKTDFDETKADIMTVNFHKNDTRTDWVPEKALLGLQKGKGAEPSKSIWAAIQILCWKGNKAYPYLQQNGYEAYYLGWLAGENGEWWDYAVQKYNGGGVANYSLNVKARFNSSKLPKPHNYA